MPEDFYVKEIFDIKTNDNGDFSYFLLKKKNLTTSDAIKIICNKIGLNAKQIGFSGNKDKKAITEQYISIHNLGEKRDFEFHNISLKFIGFGNRRINLGSHDSNEFVITVRNLDQKCPIKPCFIINYFDEQRFSKNNVETGTLILQRRFDDVAGLFKANDLNHFRRKNRRLLRFYIHSVQGYIFNQVLSSYLKDKYKEIKNVKYSLGMYTFVDKRIKNFKLPLVGFDAEIDKRFLKYYNCVMKELGIKRADFLIREMPELIEETVYRNILADVKGFKTIEYSGDEQNNGKFKQTISFRLPKGSYATILIKEYFD